MQLAFIHAAQPGAVDDALRAVAGSLKRAGRRLAGVVQQPAGVVGGHPCDGDLIDLFTGRRAPIHQALGSGSTGCRLDANALETMVAAVERGMAVQRPELLIVNRFGKIEAAGRGFCPVIAKALDLAIPVVVGVNDLNRPAFDAFAAGIAVELPDRPSAILEWVAPLLEDIAA